MAKVQIFQPPLGRAVIVFSALQFFLLLHDAALARLQLTLALQNLRVFLAQAFFKLGATRRQHGRGQRFGQFDGIAAMRALDSGVRHSGSFHHKQKQAHDSCA